MKQLWRCLWLTSIFANSLMAQTDVITVPQAITAAEFNTILRDMDLNADTQEGYSIAKSEYALLLTAWSSLSIPDRQYLMNSRDGWQDYALMLLSDLLIGTPWEDHLKKASQYQAIGLSLTVSRYKNHLSLKRARKTLVDFLHEGPSMVTDGRLVLDGQLKIQAQARAGSKALKRLEQWEELINSRQGQSDWQKLTAVNDFFNHQITVALDENTAKGYDYWQSPVETLVRGKGDCDDFAMAKYISLRLLGIPPQQLRVGIVEHTSLGGHCVLFFYPLNESVPWVLDNLTSERLGSDLGRIRRLSSRVLFNEMKPLWGMTENILTEFHKDLSETVTDNNPREVFPAFATALVNSQRVLPQDENPSLVHASLAAKH